MAPEWIYLLKVNAGIALFYAFYKLFCCRDTFFRWRRFTLLGFLAISFLYPLLDIQQWIKEQPSMVELADYYAIWMLSEELSVTPQVTTIKTPDLMTICMYIYVAGVIIMSMRFLIQLCSILFMRYKGKVTYIRRQRIIGLPTESNPFSFFKWIFIQQKEIYDESLEEIIMHEQTHVRQWHSVDVVISELVNIVCWFNPFSWLLKSEIRLNLEYLADNKVAEVLQNTKVYQYHLLGLASQNRKTGLYNNFNVSHLKHRIIMMNKKRTRAIGHLKYALFVPLAAALLIARNISCISNELKEQTESSETETTSRTALPEKEIREDGSTVYYVVEEMPNFPGGMGECMKYLSKNIKYPTEAMEKEIQGRVIVQFIVEKDGSITEAKVVRGVDPALDKEALRVINSMPKWTPGKHAGEAVNVKYTVPIMFKIPGKDSDIIEVKDKNGNTIGAGTKREAQVDENGVYMVCDEMPTFPGGMRECMNYLSKSIKYPAEAIDKKIQGRVIVQFVVKEDGSISEAKVVRGIDPLLDKEALRVTNSMPKWTPGKQDGKAVSVKYTIPISFKL